MSGNSAVGEAVAGCRLPRGRPVVGSLVAGYERRTARKGPGRATASKCSRRSGSESLVASTQRYPEHLAALVSEYFPELPGDLFPGSPLKYALIDEGYLLYSIGPNGADDGDRSRDSQPMGDDITVKLIEAE